MRLLVTGGAGFVGSSLALALKSNHPAWDVTALDNLKRRGSELGLSRLAAGGVRFLHGDVRVPTDLDAAGGCDLLLECSAEPSVLAGLDGSPAYVLDTNLGGTVNCLEFARRRSAAFLFLSTSRVYPIEALARLPLREAGTRFELAVDPSSPLPGISEHGIAESFPLEGARSLYGATKLCSELLVMEYVASYGMAAVVNRCGVLAGPWQMGRVDQGVVMHWAASHLFGWPLQYIGYGGTGKQVRDILHVADLAELIELQIPRIRELRGRTFNVGGGREVSVSLLELTDLCVAATARRVPVTAVPETRVADIPLYLTDSRRVRDAFGWVPRRSPADVVGDCVDWLRKHQESLLEVFDPAGDRRRAATVPGRLSAT
jgi:CDP-paratose 2-epimerase